MVGSTVRTKIYKNSIKGPLAMGLAKKVMQKNIEMTKNQKV